MNAITIVTLILSASPGDYDPSTSSGRAETLDLVFRYESSQRGNEGPREVPLRIYVPQAAGESQTAASTATASHPVILFSHGLGGSREAGGYLGKHWAGRGYVMVAMQHHGSDRDVMQDVPIRERLAVLKKAANTTAAIARYRDVTATIDHLESLNKSHPKLRGRLDLARLGMSGHSFGALTTQGVCGQQMPKLPGMAPVSESRIKAAMPLSPSPPRFGSTEKAFGSVEIPWLLMTGTRDKSVVGHADAADRRKVYAALPSSGHFYELVFEGGEHFAFADVRSRLLGRRHNPNHHKAIQAISTSFFDAYLRSDAAAKAWLKGDGPRSVLESGDIWQKK